MAVAVALTVIRAVVLATTVILAVALLVVAVRVRPVLSISSPLRR